MKNQVLSIEQMQKLKELGIDISKASMCYKLTAHSILNPFEYELCIGNDGEIPTFTLHDILKLMPVLYKTKDGVICNEPSYECLVFNLYMFKLEWIIEYTDGENVIGECFRDIDPLNAAYNMLVWLKKNKYI